MAHALLISLCSWWNIICKIGEVVTDAIAGIFGTILEILYDVVTFIVTEAVKLIIKTVGTLWMKVPAPPIADDSYRPQPAVEFVQGSVMWLAMALAAISVIIAGTRMAWTSRGTPVRELGKSLLTFVAVTAIGVGFISVLTKAGDDFAQWVIDDPGGGETFDQRIDKAFDNLPEDAKLILVLFLGLAAIISSIVQIGLMFVRNGMLILLVGVLPLAAAATNTEMGKAWFRRIVGWVAAFLCYKPLAALIYSAAIRLMGSSDGDWMAAATGIAMMVMAVVAMPALLRFVSPNTGG
jgi:hypothetical protein